MINWENGTRRDGRPEVGAVEADGAEEEVHAGDLRARGTHKCNAAGGQGNNKTTRMKNWQKGR